MIQHLLTARHSSVPTHPFGKDLERQETGRNLSLPNLRIVNSAVDAQLVFLCPSWLRSAHFWTSLPIGIDANTRFAFYWPSNLQHTHQSCPLKAHSPHTGPYLCRRGLLLTFSVFFSSAPLQDPDPLDPCLILRALVILRRPLEFVTDCC